MNKTEPQRMCSLALLLLPGTKRKRDEKYIEKVDMQFSIFIPMLHVFLWNRKNFAMYDRMTVENLNLESIQKCFLHRVHNNL